MNAIGQLNPDQTSLVVNIIKSIEKAVGMTRKYLDLSRIEKGELQVHLRELDLIQEVVKPLLEEFAETLAARKIVLDNQLPPTLPFKGDKDLLQVVFKNLIDNAIKYGKTDGTIKLRFTPGTPLLQFEVWNQGDNYSEIQLAQMFDKFVRLRRSEGLTQGTGLGLFITRDIIRKHGGEIRAECKGDQWIGFVFTLPSPS
jgi:signal transduction histidine kinase